VTQLATVDLPFACYWIEIEDDVVVKAPPIARWMIGKQLANVKEYAAHKGGSLIDVARAPSTQPCTSVSTAIDSLGGTPLSNYVDNSPSIQAQCAFKGAIDYAVFSGLNLVEEEDQETFEIVYAFLNDALTTVVEINKAAANPVPLKATRAGGSAKEVEARLAAEAAVAQRVRDEFDATDYDEDDEPGAGVTVVNTKNRHCNLPVPAWLVEQAEAKGVTEVYDNRQEDGTPPFSSKGSRMPSFKQAIATEGLNDEQKKAVNRAATPFWDPAFSPKN